MREFHSFLAAAQHIGEMIVAEREAEHKALEKAAVVIERRAKAIIGEYQPAKAEIAAWAELADATKADRLAHGYPEDEPLLRTGEMRDSIGHVVKDMEAEIGSNSDIAVYQELGTAKIPPRSFLGGAAVDSIETVKKILVGEVVTALVGEEVFNGRIDL